MLFRHFQWKKTTAVPYFCFLNNITPQSHLSRTLFWHFQQYKTPAVPNFSILITLKPSRTLFQHFQWKRTAAVPYFCFLNNIRSQPYLNFTSC